MRARWIKGGVIFPRFADTSDTLCWGGRCWIAKTGREFTLEFKRQAVALLESCGRPQMSLAAELGIAPSMLRQWRTSSDRARAREAYQTCNK